MYRRSASVLQAFSALHVKVRLPVMLPDQQRGMIQLSAPLHALSILSAISGMGMTRGGGSQYLYTRDHSLHLTVGSIREPHITRSAQNSHPCNLQCKAPTSVLIPLMTLLMTHCWSTHHQVAMHSCSIMRKGHALTEVLQKPPFSWRVEVNELVLSQVEGIHSGLPLQQPQSCVPCMWLQAPQVSAHNPALHCLREAAPAGLLGSPTWQAAS